MKLARIALTLNHGNADIERGFSKNKLMVTSHRTRLSMPTINGLRTVSSYVLKYSSEPHKLTYSKDLIGSIRSSHSKYEERKRQETEVRKRKKKMQMMKKVKCMTFKGRTKVQSYCFKKE